MKLYLDVSCLNRPFDDQTQPRIRLESVAVTIILDRIESSEWESVSSRMAEIEVAAIPNETRRKRVLLLLPDNRMELNSAVFDRARELVDLRVAAADAVHVAAAEQLGADVLLTCDDRLLRRCRRIADRLGVRVENPLQWLEDQENAENNE